MELLENLNDAQKKAVTHGEGPLLIVAGAGTGKTTVIAKRVAWLIDSGKAKMDHILALTFTDKAAAEMEERVDKLLPLGYTDLWISTFHAFGERMLKQHALDIGVPYDFKILTETEQWLLVREHLREFNLNYYRPLGNPTKFIHALLRHFSRAKDEEIYPEAYLKYAESARLDLDKESAGKAKKKKKTDDIDVANEVARIEEVAHAYHVYQQLLLNENALDFGDLINYTLKLFRTRPDILALYQKQFSYILVDEFQDTNWAQYELVKMLAAPANNLNVVGDDDQSIYRFRGASMSNILQFKKDYPGAASVVLTQNYRSSQNILDLAYGFIQHNNPNRLEAQLKSANDALTKKLQAVTTELAEIQHLAGKTQEDEETLIIDKILKLKALDKETEWSDFAILARSNDQANMFDTALARAGIPHQSYTSRGLYSKPVIIDALSYLRSLDNYHESPALWRVMNFACWGLALRDAVELSHHAHRKSMSLFAALEQGDVVPNISAEGRTTFRKILNFITAHSLFARERKPTEVLVRALNDIGYTVAVEKRGEAVARVDFSFLNQLYQRMKRWEDSQVQPSLKNFVDTITYEIESGEEGALALDPEIGPDVVRVMTVHAAKGLEFKYVFLVSLVDRRFPTTERRDPIEIPTPLIKEILPEGDVHLEEERRLFYVAMTRAKRGLYFTSAEDYGGARKKKPSVFLVELGLKLAEPKRVVDENHFALPSEQPAVEHDVRDFLPAKFSFTQLKAFETCPFQYRFAHVLKVPVWGRHTFSFGSSMHLTLERFFGLIQEHRAMKQASLFGAEATTTLPTLDDLLRLYDESWIDDWYENEKQKQEYYDQGKRILKDFFEQHREAWPETKYLERGFTLKIGPHTITGKVDRIDTKNGGVEIIDYKTGRVPKDINEVDKDQLLIYQMAAEVLWNEKPVALTFYYLNENKPLSFLGTPEDLQEIQQKISATIEEIQKGKFPPTPSPNVCKFCDYKDICEFRQLS